ncbi:hypothetical protein Taro_014596 [Colocasia esculenta]|uniref:CCHC-type domain-containing protein n=1 Tax=Colocasia esculenta TaxID=4460 RepID=A0A843UFC8_COLES|nr:hypothetical protein [Colocasia esculenta]
MKFKRRSKSRMEMRLSDERTLIILTLNCNGSQPVASYETMAGLTQALQNVVQAGNQAAAARNGAKDTMAKVEGIEGKDISKPTSIKRGSIDITGTFHNNNNNNDYNNNKRPTTGKSYGMEKKIKVEETITVEYCNFCNKPGHQADKCWKKTGLACDVGVRNIVYQTVPCYKTKWMEQNEQYGWP